MYVSNLANDRLPYIIFNSANVADERPLQCIISFSPDSIPPTDVQRYIKGTMRIIYTSNIIKTIISREGDVVDDIFFYSRPSAVHDYNNIVIGHKGSIYIYFIKR